MIDPFFGTLLQVGGGLLSSLFGRKKKQPVPTRVTPAQIRAEAEAAGFNPLTVLTASAGGGFGMNPAPATNLGSLDLIGDAVAGIGTAIERADPIERETKKLENELLRRQIDAVNATADKQVQGVSQRYGIGVREIPAVRRITSPVRTSRTPARANVDTTARVPAPRELTAPAVEVGPAWYKREDMKPEALAPRNISITSDAARDMPMVVDPLDPYWRRRYGESEITDNLPGGVNFVDDVLTGVRKYSAPGTVFRWLPNVREMVDLMSPADTPARREKNLKRGELAKRWSSQRRNPYLN